MEDALRESAQNLIGKVFDVLILVLMEDALREMISLIKEEKYNRLNPCSNGRCSARLHNLGKNI